MKQLMRPGVEDEYGILKLQNIILNIMKYIHDLCEKHQIEYYIIGGTALGAVRHGGCIPWDDDLDIAISEQENTMTLRTAERANNLLAKINSALDRIENGTYGYSVISGDEIGLARMLARPLATMTIEEQEEHEKRE